jgi:hypothetical protein
VFKESKVHIHEKVCVQLDSGYEGIKVYHSNSSHPHKNTKKHPLTKKQKKENHEISSGRVHIEHAIRELKVFRILSERYRNRRKRFGLRTNLIASIYNYELNEDFD